MSIKIDTLNKFKKYCEDYTEQDDWAVGIRAAYEKTLNLLTKDNVVNNNKMQAVIGFDENDNPVFWDLEKDNLLSTCGCGQGTYLFGQDIALASLDLRFDKSEFAYYMLSGDGTYIWNTTNDEHCLDFWGLFSNEGSQLTITEYLAQLKNVLDKRIELSQEQLANEPFLLFIFSVPNIAFRNGNDVKVITEILNIIIDKGKELRVATYLSEHIPLVFSAGACYYPFLDRFSAKLFGASFDLPYVKSNEDIYCIDKQLSEELTAINEGMQCCAKDRNFLRAYFIDGRGTKQKIWFANYFMHGVIMGNKSKR